MGSFDMLFVGGMDFCNERQFSAVHEQFCRKMFVQIFEQTFLLQSFG